MPRVADAYRARVARALRARRDVWGEASLSQPNGPTLTGARRYLAPLRLAGGPGKRALTPSGFHYVPFGGPVGAGGASVVALHVADGSRVLAERVDGTSLTVHAGAEVFGSCPRRSRSSRLAEGWLPILLTEYVDRHGNRYSQESFTTREGPRGKLATFVSVVTRARARTRVRVTLERGGTAAVDVPPGATRVLRVEWRRGSRLRRVTAAAYATERRGVEAYWPDRLTAGASLEVPERVVMDAYRALLVQNLSLTWRYSIGNPYEQFSFPEGLDAAQVMAEWGFRDVSRAILRTSLTRRPRPYPNWKMGEKLVGTAVYYRLHRDKAHIAAVTPTLRRYVDGLGRQLGENAAGLLLPERYSSDIPDTVYGLHSQSVVWQGMRGMGAVWAATGHRREAARARAVARRLEPALRRAVRSSQRRLDDGSLFVPISLLSNERPYGSVTETRLGSYWNLVMPYALASGLFRPGSAEARGIFRYMRLHGSRLLGLVRAGAYALYEDPVFPTGGTDEVYGINVARFLAENDLPEQLVLGLYGQLAVAMAPGTYVGGEAASVEPIRGVLARSTYLPPNAASNAAFLTKLRLMLVQETRGRDGEPSGLRLAFATPRTWLRPGRRIVVRGMPTSFGPVSYELTAGARSARAVLEIPAREAPPRLQLRIRLPDNRRLVRVRVDGGAPRGVDGRAGTIDVTGARGRVEVVAETT